MFFNNAVILEPQHKYRRSNQHIGAHWTEVLNIMPTRILLINIIITLNLMGVGMIESASLGIKPEDVRDALMKESKVARLSYDELHKYSAWLAKAFNHVPYVANESDIHMVILSQYNTLNGITIDEAVGNSLKKMVTSESVPDWLKAQSLLTMFLSTGDESQLAFSVILSPENFKLFLRNTENINIGVKILQLIESSSIYDAAKGVQPATTYEEGRAVSERLINDHLRVLIEGSVSDKKYESNLNWLVEKALSIELGNTSLEYLREVVLGVGTRINPALRERIINLPVGN